MTDPIKSPLSVSGKERLDEITESSIEAVICAGIEWGELPEGDPTERGKEDEVDRLKNALRQRIRVLIEEALVAERERILAGVVQLGEMTHVDYDDD